MLPGCNFGRPEEELTIRIALVNFDGAEVLRASRALPEGTVLDETFLAKYCGSVVEAADRLCDWLQS